MQKGESRRVRVAKKLQNVRGEQKCNVTAVGSFKYYNKSHKSYFLVLLILLLFL